MDALILKRHLYLIAIIMVVSVGGILYGFNLGVISGALLFIERSIVLTTRDIEMVVGAAFAGGLIGTLIAGSIADYFGRRKLVAASALIFSVGIACIISAHTFYTLFLGQTLMGIGMGWIAVGVPLYTVELAPTAVRGRAVASFQLFLTFGLLLAYFVDLLFTQTGNWRGMFAIAFIPTLILFLGVLLLPESPRFLVARGKEKKARDILLSTRTDEEVKHDLKEIHDSLTHSKATWRELFSRRSRMPLLLAGSIAFLQQMTGVNSFLQYAPLMLKSSGMSSNMITMLGSVGIGLVNMIMTVISMSLVDRVGRRPLLMTGLMGILISEIYLGVVQYLPLTPEWRGGLSLLGLMAFILMYAFGPGVVIWLVMSELFPTRIRGKGLSVCLFLNALGSTVVASVFLTLDGAMGMGGVYFVGAFFALCYFLIAKFLPETNARSLEEIQTIL